MFDYEFSIMFEQFGNGNDKFAVKRSDIVYRNMQDPRMIKLYYTTKTLSLLGKDELIGSSPPDLFVGRFGYPKVFIGPLIPPEFGDTSIYSSPETWVGKSIPDIIGFRSTLVRGMYRTDAKNVENGRVEEAVRDLALTDKFVTAEAAFTRKPVLNNVLNEEVTPFGPSAPIKQFHVEHGSTNRHLEDAYSDTSMGAKTAMLELYEKGLPVTKIQRALSAGILGMDKNRKFVPTRWSITAVDDTISKTNLEAIKSYDPIDSPMIYEINGLDNRWLVMMFPGAWSYELVEAWYPNTSWNDDPNKVAIFSSYEFYDGRKKYAEIGGCYYAARLAVSELLEKKKRQAMVAILRETHSGYTLPVGVWNVREHVRAALKTEPKMFASNEEAIKYVGSVMEITVPTWLENSTVLRNILLQKRLFS